MNPRLVQPRRQRAESPELFAIELLILGERHHHAVKSHVNGAGAVAVALDDGEDGDAGQLVNGCRIRSQVRRVNFDPWIEGRMSLRGTCGRTSLQSEPRQARRWPSETRVGAYLFCQFRPCRMRTMLYPLEV